MRHDFEPGKLVAGLVLLAASVLCLGDMAGWWWFPSYALLPGIVAGFCLAGVVTSLSLTVRRHRNRRRGLETDA
ncbi:hypothetical protein [Streptomyces sp. NPDC049555]|uniref:hypothetical protein n=1 Tax=unclassified Streptomyces TaxID=2593676 RepID=UPI00343E18B6